MNRVEWSRDTIQSQWLPVLMIVLMSPEFVVLLNFKRSETQRLILIPLLKKGEKEDYITRTHVLKNKEA